MENLIAKISKAISLFAGLALSIMMFLTFADVVLRAGGVPIIGTYEIVSLLLALTTALGLPQVTMEKGHVYMEFVLEKLGERGKRIMNTITRLCVIFLFLLAGIYMIKVGKVYRMSGEVTATVKIPFYPFAYTVALCCFIQCAVLLREVISLWGKK
jgi:TRAP-type C4-dicarboxylate transport system permease small subunit